MFGYVETTVGVSDDIHYEGESVWPRMLRDS